MSQTEDDAGDHLDVVERGGEFGVYSPFGVLIAMG